MSKSDDTYGKCSFDHFFYNVMKFGKLMKQWQWNQWFDCGVFRMGIFSFADLVIF